MATKSRNYTKKGPGRMHYEKPSDRTWQSKEIVYFGNKPARKAMRKRIGVVSRGF